MAKISTVPPKRLGAHLASRALNPTEKPQNFKSTLWTLWGFIGLEKKALFVVGLLVLLSNIAQLVAPYLLGKGLDAIAMQDPMSILIRLCLALSALYLLGGLFQILEGVIMARASQRIVAVLRKTLFLKLTQMNMDFFAKSSQGDLMSRFTNDVDNISTTLSDSLVGFFNGILTLILCSALMMVLSPILFLCALSTIPLMALITWAITKKTADRFRDQQRHMGHLNGFIEERISGFELTKAFAQESQTQSFFESLNGDLAKSSYEAQLYAGLLMPMMNVINNFGYVLIAFVGGYLAVNNQITLGVITGFLAYVRRFNRPLIEIAGIFNLLQSAVAGAERIFHLFEKPLEEGTSFSNDTRDKATSIYSPLPPTIKGEIQFSHLHFSYEQNKEVLHDIDFLIHPGQTAALVGSTGAGKTTIVQLLTRLYDTAQGQILLDGVPISMYDRRDFRRLFGYVPQEAKLFNGNIRDNIAYGKSHATFEEVKQAAFLSGCKDFIERLPHGYQTLLSEGGSSLSQGEKQLLTIARAILADPPILILDEATSSVDTQTELLIQETLKKIRKNKTTFLIAHRLSTISSADIILVIENGRLVEQGNHHDLMRKNGYYASLVKSQQGILHP